MAEPGLGDAPCTTWALSAFINQIGFQAGRPSSKFAFRWSSTFRSSPSGSNLSIFLVRFQSFNFPHAVPICRSSASVSGLAAFFIRFQSYDFLRPFPVFRPSPSFLRSNLSIGGFCLTGNLSYSSRINLSKPEIGYLDNYSQLKYK